MNPLDQFKKFQMIVEGKECKEEKDDKKQVKKDDKKQDKKPANVKESGSAFFRKYADIIAEAEDYDEEDPDVAKAEAVKGKDGKKQADFEKGKKWNFDKADKKAEEKGVKSLKKDKEALKDSTQRKGRTI